MAAYFPGERDEGATLGSDRRAVLGVFRVLGSLRRDAGDVRGEVDGGLTVRSDCCDVKDDAAAGGVRV